MIAKSTDKIFVGTKLKYLVDISAAGFDITTDPFSITLERGSIRRVFNKSDLMRGENQEYYLCFDTEDFGPGVVKATIIVKVPDSHFLDGYREEVQKFELVNILP